MHALELPEGQKDKQDAQMHALELPEGQKDKQDAQIDRQLEFKNAKMKKVGELIQFHR